MKKINTKQLVTCALLSAVGGLLTGPLSFYFGSWKISFASIPVMIAGIMFGPLLGGLTGFTADLIGFFLAPRGAYNPLFSISFALFGIIAGLVYKNSDKPTIGKLLVTTVSTQFICSLILNSLIMVYCYGVTKAIFITKFAYNAVMVPINAVVLQILLKSVVYKFKNR